MLFLFLNSYGWLPSLWTDFAIHFSRCQFHQHLTSSIFLQKLFVQLLIAHILGVYFFDRNNVMKIAF